MECIPTIPIKSLEKIPLQICFSGLQNWGGGLRLFSERKMTGHKLFQEMKMAGLPLFSGKKNNGAKTFREA